MIVTQNKNFRDLFSKSTCEPQFPISDLLMQPMLYDRPRLLKPPHEFRTLLKHYMGKTCARCEERPKKSVICGLPFCGEYTSAEVPGTS